MNAPLGPSWRNWSLGVLYLATCIWLAYLSPDTSIKDLGPLCTQIGVSVGLIVCGRAANKWAARKPSDGGK